MKLEELLEKFTDRTRFIFGDALVGVYLHGSAVMGCYNHEKSDIDLIVVVDGSIPDDRKRRFMDMVVELNRYAPEKGIEMSVVRRDVCSPFVYPTPFELHFSVMHLEWYTRAPADYVARMNGVDKDLAAHFTVIRSRGRTLCGAPIDEVFGTVPDECYFDSILCDVGDAETDIIDDSVYITLNLCRVLAYRLESLVLSKKEGGEWGLRNLPEKYHPLISSALTEYAGGGTMAIDATLAAEYAADMLARIRKDV